MKPLSVPTLCAATLLLTAAAFAQPPAGADINWQNGYIIASGQGTGNRADSKAKARIKATTAAKVAAQRNMLEMIKGIRITSETTVQDAMLSEDVVKTRVDGMLKGAFAVGEPYVEYVDDLPVVTVTMKGCLNDTPKECAGRPTLTSVLELDQRPTPSFVPTTTLLASVPPQLASAEPTDAPRTGNWRPPVYDAGKPVTGLVVSLGGHYFERELLPVVITQGQPEKITVYSVKVIKPSVVRTYGAVRYVDSMDRAKATAMVGSNPMIITAEAVTKDNMIMIRSSDAKLIKESLAHGNDYLGDAKFMILVR